MSKTMSTFEEPELPNLVGEPVSNSFKKMEINGNNMKNIDHLEDKTEELKSLDKQPTDYGLSTRCSHSGTRPSDWAHSPIMPPVYMSTTFEVLDPNNAPYDYSRSGNPTRTELEKFLASIESARFGLAFSSGLGAMTTAIYLLKSGQHILCSDDVYGGTYRLLARCVSRMGIDTTFVDGCDLGAWRAAFRQGQTRMVWIETPTNPMMKIIDIAAVAAIIKRLDEKCIVVVDNTFMTPVFQSPLELGADLVLHSCTKYIGGHSDVVMGALITNNKTIFEELSFLQNSLGIVPSPFDCSQMIRSIKTMDIRVRHQANSAAKIATFLQDQTHCIDRVIYPGLSSHPQHELAKRQCPGFGGMISVQLKSIKGDEGVRMMQAIKMFHAAVSLGCVTSLIEVPALMTHCVVPKETRNKLGMTDQLIRISVGLESVDDLIGDLKQALEKVYPRTQK